MNEIITILASLRPLLSTKSFKQLPIIIEALLSMTGRVTFLGLSRWTEQGGSYRTIQRFFKQSHDWSQWRWVLIKTQLHSKLVGTWLLIGDEVVVTKSGKKTHGLGRFFHQFKEKWLAVYVFSTFPYFMLNRDNLTL